ncbi:hypothetical protein BZA70DRAFT_311577 [Myxozyma melibiosi]|uniref:CRIB domain-containing protein n=1 Tax=Myxozyma melibiosi TaxID=54550 RepID=A0ABR1F3V8_9ASCO
MSDTPPLPLLARGGGLLRSLSTSSRSSVSSSRSSASSQLRRYSSLRSPAKTPDLSSANKPLISSPISVSHSTFPDPSSSSDLDTSSSSSMLNVGTPGASAMRQIAKRLEDVAVPGPPMRDIWLKNEAKTSSSPPPKRKTRKESSFRTSVAWPTRAFKSSHDSTPPRSSANRESVISDPFNVSHVLHVDVDDFVRNQQSRRAPPSAPEPPCNPAPPAKDDDNDSQLPPPIPAKNPRTPLLSSTTPSGDAAAFHTPPVSPETTGKLNPKPSRPLSANAFDSSTTTTSPSKPSIRRYSLNPPSPVSSDNRSSTTSSLIFSQSWRGSLRNSAHSADTEHSALALGPGELLYKTANDPLDEEEDVDDDDDDSNARTPPPRPPRPENSWLDDERDRLLIEEIMDSYCRSSLLFSCSSVNFQQGEFVPGEPVSSRRPSEVVLEQQPEHNNGGASPALPSIPPLNPLRNASTPSDACIPTSTTSTTTISTAKPPHIPLRRRSAELFPTRAQSLKYSGGGLNFPLHNRRISEEPDDLYDPAHQRSSLLKANRISREVCAGRESPILGGGGFI